MRFNLLGREIELAWSEDRHLVTCLVAVFPVLIGCDSLPDPSPNTTTVVETTTTEATTTTISAPTPDAYITRERAGRCSSNPDASTNTGLCRELFSELQENASRGWRDFIVLAERCHWSLIPNVDAIFPITVNEAEAIAGVGAQLDREGWQFMQRLGEINRRCDSTPVFCGRTNVQKQRFSNDDRSGYRDRLRMHLEYARELRAYLDGQPNEGETWDSIGGWCRVQ